MDVGEERLGNADHGRIGRHGVRLRSNEKHERLASIQNNTLSFRDMGRRGMSSRARDRGDTQGGCAIRGGLYANLYRTQSSLATMCIGANAGLGTRYQLGVHHADVS